MNGDIPNVPVPLRTVQPSKVERCLEPGGVVHVVGEERKAEEAGVGPVDAAHSRRKTAAGARTGRARRASTEARQFAVRNFDVEVGKLHVIAV